MPFKSKAQQRFMFAAEADGELPKGTARRWAHHTKNIKKLPEKVSMQNYTDKMASYLHHLADQARTGPARSQIKQASLDNIYKVASVFAGTGNLTQALAAAYPGQTAQQRQKLAADLVHNCWAWHQKVAAVVDAIKTATVMMGGAAPAAPAAPATPRMAPSRATTTPAASGGGVSALAAMGS